jgi:hypothetical protein
MKFPFSWRIVRCTPTAVIMSSAILLGSYAAEPANSRPVEPPHGPQLSVAQPSHDFGKVTEGQRLQHTFQIMNSGDADLAVITVEPSCGCTTTGDWPHRLSPGQTGMIPVTVDTTHFSGPITKTITIVTNTPGTPTMVLSLDATISTPISIANTSLLFPAVEDPNETATRATTIRAEVADTLRLTDLQSDSPLFAPQLREVIPGKEYELVVKTVPPLPEGTQAGRITLHTSNKEMPVLSINAVVTVLPALQIAPSAFTFYAPKLAAAEKRFAVVMNHRGRDLQVFDVSTNAPGVQLSMAPSEDHKRFTITVTFPAGFEVRSSDRFHLQGKTNQSSMPTFMIPIVYRGKQ